MRVAIFLSIILAARVSVADPPTIPTRLNSRAHVTTEGGTDLDLPPGWYVVPPDKWSALDLEMRRLQDAETRLTAENESLRGSTGGAGFLLVVCGALAAGFAAGVLVAR